MKIKSTSNGSRVVNNIPSQLTTGNLEGVEEFASCGIVPYFVLTFSLFSVFFILLPVENPHIDQKVVVMS